MNKSQKLSAQLRKESERAYRNSIFSSLSRDYFARLIRNPEKKFASSEILLDNTWKIIIPADAGNLARLMAKHLQDFMRRSMQVRLSIEKHPREIVVEGMSRTITLLDAGGGDPRVLQSFTIKILPNRVMISGRSPEGLRDGVVALVDRMGLRQAPILSKGEQIYCPRLAVRLGSVPWLGSHREAVFLGYNAVLLPGADPFSISTSDAIPELAGRRNPALLSAIAKQAQEAHRYGLKTYIMLNDSRSKFLKDDPLFRKYPEIRGALTYNADGEYILCTEHHLVRRYLSETIAGIFRVIPELNGIVIIIGGEGFYHCFMHPYGASKGHTNCPRCEKLGAETAVSNLCNYLAAAVREINPQGEVVAWPYSAFLWSADTAQVGFIKKLKPGTAIFTEIEKDEYVEKPEGFKKLLWDYSIDLIGPGDRAKRQIETCHNAGIPIYLKSEPELAFEASGLPHIPCLDRWLTRAEALASCGADGAWIFPAVRCNYGSSACESYKYVWWEPHADQEEILRSLASRIAGRKAGPYLRKAWKLVSEAIPLMPEFPNYYVGPHYLGPAHPMCVDLKAEIPKIFYGQLLFRGEITAAEGLKLRPTFVTSPTGDVPVFGRLYRRMEKLLARAVQEVNMAKALVPKRNKLTFQAEVSSIRWFYHTVRSEANFYESCQLRERFGEQDPSDIAKTCARWLEVLKDERENAKSALPLMEADVRLDPYYGGDHKYSHGTDMIRAKLDLIEKEITQVLPGLIDSVKSKR